MNGILIGSAGDPENGRANIWNAAMVFPIDDALVRARNEIVFEFHHEYNAGLNGIILLTGMDSARVVLGMTASASGAWSYISIGLHFSGCIVILLMIMLNQRLYSLFIFISGHRLIRLCVYPSHILPHLHISIRAGQFDV